MQTENLREYVLKTADQKTYDKCNVPRPAEEAESDLDGFTRAVCLLRAEYRIPELVLNASVPIQGDDRDRAAIIILGNRAGAAPNLAASLLRRASEVAKIVEEENARIAAAVDWAAARAALEGVGDPSILADVRRLVEEAKDLPAAQDAAAGFGAALRVAGLWCGRQRDALLSLVRALGGEPPGDEWRWAGRAGCDWEGAERALASWPIDGDVWKAIRSRRRVEAFGLLHAAAETAEAGRVTEVQDVIDSLTEVDEVVGAVIGEAKDPDADYGELERRVGRVLERLAGDDPRRGRAETLRATMERRKVERQ